MLHEKMYVSVLEVRGDGCAANARGAVTNQPERESTLGFTNLHQPARSRVLFDLIHRIPGIQVMGDTTDLKVLGVPLKLIGLQDPGRRLSRLFEGFGIYSRERSREVVDLVTRVLSDQPGTQFITDQGTPYLAELARETYESLELVHAPQKEGTPTAKATLERAFGVVKESLRPLLALTNRLADQCPALKDADLAQSLGQLLVAVQCNKRFRR